MTGRPSPTPPPRNSPPKIEFPRTNLVPITNTTPNHNRMPHALTDLRESAFIRGPQRTKPHLRLAQRGRQPPLQAGSTTELGSIYNILADVQTQIKILQSSTLAKATRAKMPRASYEAGLPASQGRISAWRQALNLPEPKKQNTEQPAAASTLKARASGQTRIIELTFDSPDPAYAATYLNTLTNEFIEQNIDARWKMMQRTGDWLTRQLDDVKIKLERSEDALQNYARNSGLILTGSIGGCSSGESKQNVTEEKLRQIQTSLTAVQSERVSSQSRYEMAKSAPPSLSPTSSTTPVSATTRPSSPTSAASLPR